MAIDPKTAAEIAKEVLAKPTSSVVDALMAPKIERLRQWAQTRDIRGRVDAIMDNPEGEFESYLQRLLRRVAGIKTIVFPEQVLPLPQIYEPIWLSDKIKKKKVNPSALMNAGACSYIVDEGGMGKSTFVKYLILQEILEGELIPVFIELRRIPAGGSIFDAINIEFNEPGKVYDRQLLLRLFSAGQFLVILDGYDEISDLSRALLSSEIEKMTYDCPRCAFIITSRPDVNLPTVSNAKGYSLVYLTPAQAQSVVRRLDSCASIDVGERLIQKFNIVPKRFLETPLLIALLYRTYGFNNSISAQVSTFYSEIYDAFYKGHDLTKSGFSREKKSGLDVDEFRRLLRCFAFLLVCQQASSISSMQEAVQLVEKAAKLTGFGHVSPSKWIDDLTTAVPLLIRDGTEFRFLHKTIGEFFAAEYLSYSGKSEQMWSKITAPNIIGRFGGTFRFLSEINPLLFRKQVAVRIAKAALKHQPKIPPLARTSTFLGESYISIWPRAEVEIKGKDHNSISLPTRSPGGFSGESYHYGQAGGVDYILVSSHVNVREDIRLTWSMISEPYEANDMLLHYQDYDFTRIVKLIPNKTWFSIKDPLIINLYAESEMQPAFYLQSLFAEMPDESQEKASGRTIRVISDKKCRDLVRITNQDEKISH